MLKARISSPSTAARGEIVTIKTLVAHPMETGFRRDAAGKPIPRDILAEFECFYDGRLVFRAELNPAVAANPFIAFHLKVDRTGELLFRWRDQHGAVTDVTREISVGG